VGRDVRPRADALRAGPWCWPPDWDPESVAAAEAVTGLDEPPPTQAGSALLLTVSDVAGAVWLLRVGAADAPGHPLGPDARTAWGEAAVAIARTAPILWRSLGASAPPPVELLGLVPRPGEAASPRRVVDGRSLGLAMALARASAAVGYPLDANVAATATIDPFGAVGPVDGLALKARTLAEVAPRVTRLLVSASQPEGDLADAREHGLEVITVRSVAEAIDLALPGLDAWFDEAGGDPEQRAELVASLLALALGDRTALVSWDPVRRAAERALAWPGGSPDEEVSLTLVAAIAGRHQGARPQAPLPSDAWIRALPPPARQRAVAHVVQSAADCGAPGAAAAEALAARFGAPIEDAHPAELMIHGALARLYAVTGRAAEALATQRALAEAWRLRRELADATYPLAEWYRLAGAVGDEGSYRDAVAFEERAPARTPLGPGAAWVTLARARAAAALGHRDEALALAANLSDARSAPAHVTLGALRVRAHLGDVSFEAARERVRSAPVPEPLRHRYALLLALDRACHDGEDVAAEQAVDALAEHEPEPTGHLLRAWPGAPGPPRAAWVRAIYPY